MITASFLNWLSTFATIISALTVYEIYREIRSKINAPKFMLGAIPIERKDFVKIGSKKYYEGEFEFNKKYLAIPPKKQGYTSFPKETIRRYYRGDGCIISVPVIIYNYGNRTGNYNLVITFSNDDIDVVDFYKETVDIDTIFTKRINILNNNLKKFVTPKPIREIYLKIGLNKGHIGFFGVLESKVFEMVLLKLFVPKHIRKFELIFKLDCKESYIQRQIFIQRIEIIENNKDKLHSA